MTLLKRVNIVQLADFRQPITEEQYDQVKLNDKIATALVRRANTVDLKAIAEKVRR